jgi:translation initiation factor IF-3
MNNIVNGAADPPVCKLDNLGDVLRKEREKVKEKKANQKARALKEMFVGAGIDPHDLGIKMNKVKEFLGEGHPVKVVVTAKKSYVKDHPLCVEETVMKVIEAVENDAGAVQQTDSTSPMRRDFTLSPKSKKQ